MLIKRPTKRKQTILINLNAVRYLDMYQFRISIHSFFGDKYWVHVVWHDKDRSHVKIVEHEG